MKRIIVFSRQKLKSFFLISFLLIAPIFFNTGKSYAQAWLWAKSYGGVSVDQGEKICNDASGNTITGGTFSSQSINIGTLTLNNAGTTGKDICISKYDPNGNLLWVRRIGGTADERLGGICTDQNGRIYVTGSFFSTSISIPPLTIGNTGTNEDIFVACFDSFGSIVWLTRYGSAGYLDGAYDCIYSNTQSALYIVGAYSSPVLTFSTTNVINSNSSGGLDMFLAKFNSAGIPLWATGSGLSGTSEAALGVELDASNSHVFVSGTFYSAPTTAIGSTTLTSYGGRDSFLAKWSDLGVFQWALNIGCVTDDTYGDMSTDASGNLYIAGYYDGPSLFIGPSTLTNTGMYDGFLAKFNPSGTLAWANPIGSGPQQEIPLGVTVDGNNNVYVGGYFSGTVVTIGTSTVANTNPGATNDLFVVKYNNLGNTQWVSTAAGISSERATDVSADALGNLYVAGFYNVSGPTSFGTTTLNSLGGQDGFVAKIGCLTATISGISSICEGTSATLTAGGATNYTWSTGATTPSIIITPTANTSYSVLGAVGSCTGTSTNYSVTFLPASVNAGPNLNLLCNETQIINATSNPPNPVSLIWTPTIGLNNNTLLTPSVIATTSSIQYTLFANLSNGCVANDFVTISQYAPTPAICMVTVDSIGVNNLILWDKSSYPDADTFYVYRDIANNNYQLIGKVLSSSSFGEFQDTVRSLYLANGDPKVSSWRYKISYIDSCGNVSAKSPFHKTLFVQNNNGNFTWNDYQIEGQPIPVPALNNYVFRRDNVATGNWQNIQMLSSISTAYTDPNYNAFAATADWRAETQWAIQCNSNYLKTNMAATVKRSKSNLSNNRLIGLKEKSLEKFTSIYPNPSKDVINIDIRFSEDYELIIENCLGQVVYVSKENNGNKAITVNKFTKGLYSLKIKTINNVLTRKIIIE